MTLGKAGKSWEKAGKARKRLEKLGKGHFRFSAKKPPISLGVDVWIALNRVVGNGLGAYVRIMPADGFCKAATALTVPEKDRKRMVDGWSKQDERIANT